MARTPTPRSHTPDLCVVGAGTAGIAAALTGLALGAKVLLVERHAFGGGALHAGEWPARLVAAAAETAAAMRAAPTFGIAAVEAHLDLPALAARIEAVRTDLARNVSAERLAAMGVQVLSGAARFLDRATLEVGAEHIVGRRVVLATGAVPDTPAIPGLDLVRPTLAADLARSGGRPPTRLMVIGAGPEGVALAQTWRRLGVDVVLLDAGGLLPSIDPELVSPVSAALAHDGIEVRTGIVFKAFEPRGAGVRLLIAGPTLDQSVDASHLVFATGLRPMVENLGLEAAGIAFGRDGVRVNPDLRTTNGHVFAAGSVLGAPLSPGEAAAQGQAAARRALTRSGRPPAPGTVPRVVRTWPAIATIGLDEAQARARDPKARVLRWPFAESEAAVAAGVALGLVKLVVGRRGALLGVGIVGPGAPESITVWASALARGAKADEMLALPGTGMALAEAGRAVIALERARALATPGRRRLLALLRAIA